MAPRSRACQPCRDRRCKCDETLPHCNQCLKTNRLCPGPVQGAVIVDMTVATAKRAKPGYRRDCTSDFSHNVLTTVPSTAAPSSFPPTIELLFGHFINFFCGKDVGLLRDSWMYQLAHLMPESLLTVRLSSQAAALGYYAARSNDTRALSSACKIYGKALKTHRASLETLQNKVNNKTSLTVDVVRATLMLSFCEALHSSGPTAYAEHIIGATKVLEMVGPDKCNAGSLNQLFFSLRPQTVRTTCRALLFPSRLRTDISRHLSPFCHGNPQFFLRKNGSMYAGLARREGQ
jgi:hypothetical protein